MPRPVRKQLVYVDAPLPLGEALIAACKARGLEAVRSDFFPGTYWENKDGERRCGIRFAFMRFAEGTAMGCYVCDVTTEPRVEPDPITREEAAFRNDDALYDAAIKVLDEKAAELSSRGPWEDPVV